MSGLGVPSRVGKRDEKEAASHLVEAVALSAKSPPKSGRDFSKLIKEQPTFIVLNVQETFQELFTG